MFKKLTALVLVLGMVLSLFAGCQTGLLSSGKIRSPSGVVFDMNTDFNPYAFTIVLTDEAAKNIDEYDKKDFPEVQYAYVVKNGENLLWVIPEFGGKERIFGAMKLMLQRSDVLGVEPYIDETFEDATSETFVTPQGAIRADGDYYPYGFGVL